MEPNFKGFVLDPAKCSGLPFEEKRELVREIAQWSDDAPVILSSFSRKELLEIICAEMGKERKYSGFTKVKMIEHLLKLISGNSKRKKIDNPLDLSVSTSQTGAKKQRRNEEHGQLTANEDHAQGNDLRKEEVKKTLCCPNLACKATLIREDGFCKRCSCCICHRYDDNKDPCFWLICESDLTSEGQSCGLSCHLKCALRHERAGIMANSKFGKLDGKFCCVSCGKINDLMSTWRKHLLVAKEARRVDVLCSRISVSLKILHGTERYKDLHKRVDTAAKKLRKELGPLDRVCEKMGRGIVNRLACGSEVQKLCSSAVEAFDYLVSNPNTFVVNPKASPTCSIRFEECFPTSVVIVLDYNAQLFEEFLGCRIWHQKSNAKAYPDKPTYIVLRPEKRFKICDLEPYREYVCKVSLFSCTKVFGSWEAKWVTPPCIGMRVSGSNDRQLFGNFSGCDSERIIQSLNDHIKPTHLLNYESIPTTPSKVDGRQASVGPSNMENVGNPICDYEYCVKVVKSLENEGHLKFDFRVKFLTWFSLKATTQERRVVSAFVDTMANDPPSLAEQLFDAFTEEICSDRKVFL